MRDHGIGISPADQQRIFRRFERAADERQYSGAGPGLWITSELVKALGGRITLHSSPGAGAAFTVVLPRRPARHRTPPQHTFADAMAALRR